MNEEQRSSLPKADGIIPRLESFVVNTPRMEVVVRQTEHIEEPLPVAISPSASPKDPILDPSPSSTVERASESNESKQPAVLQPVLTRYHPASIQPSIQPEAQQAQRVVEIHIGRIEVRAAPPSTPVKRGSQKATTMSLEEYLRSRPGEK
jgi:hypothetical protein